MSILKSAFSTSLALLLTGTLLLGSTERADAAKPQAPPPALHLVGTTPESQDTQSILAITEELVSASNRKDLDALLKHYSPHFVSGDNLNLEQVRNLIVETWEVFPQIRYRTTPLEVRVHGDWATVESIDEATAPTQIDEGPSATPGRLVSRSRGLLFLHRLGNSWEIRSDYTLYEQATILYGPLQELDITLSTPEQVFAGESYTAKVNVNLPPTSIAFATISREPLVYPQVKPKDKFRTLGSDRQSLERIFEANALNTNEIVTATLGLTQIGQDQHERPTVDLRGVATVVKRVNVIPRSKFVDPASVDSVVREAADGSITVTPDHGNNTEETEEAPLGTDEGEEEGPEEITPPPSGTPQE